VSRYNSFLLACLALGGSLAAGQQPARDVTAPPAATVPTASVSGIVTSAEPNPQPIRRVVVTISGTELAAARAAITDDNGRFSIDGLPAGRFTLSAKKPAYLPATYGASRPGRPGIELAIASGQHVTNLSIVMTHGAAIAGVIRDNKGLPLSNARVSITRRLPDGTLAPALTATSDDRGHYRIFGLAPGEYLVTATQSSLIATTAGAPTTAEMDATLAALRARRAGGRPAGASTPALPEIRSVNLAPVFFPGVLSPADAVPVKVAAGDDRRGTDITIRFGRTATITGVVAPSVDADTVALTLTVKGSDVPLVAAGAIAQARASQDGTFTFTNVNPGSYTLQARTITAAPSGGVSPIAPGSLFWGRTDVDINGEDVRGVVVSLQPTRHFTGRLVFDGSGAQPDPTKLRVAVASTADEGARRMILSGLAAPLALPGAKPAAADGTFDVDGVVPGVMGVSVTPVPPGWTLRSVMMAGKDVLDAPFDVPADSTALPPAVITFTDRHTSLSGTIQTPAAQTPSLYSIVVFAADRALWRPGSRRVQVARAGSDARFLIKDLPPGDYFIAALMDVEPDDLLDPAFFAQLAPGAVRITLGDGEQKIQNLRIGG
jgi:hypothetical protein